MSVNLSTVISGNLAALNAASTSDADLQFWTSSSLLRFGYDAAERLARKVPAFCQRGTISVVAGTAEYNHAARHIATIHVSNGGYSLRPATVEELDALDDEWRTYADYPERYIEGIGGTKQLRLHPTPIVNATAAVIYQEYPQETTTIAAPAVLAEYFRLAILAEARGGEGKGAMPEVARWLREFVGILDQVAAGYWGAA